MEVPAREGQCRVDDAEDCVRRGMEGADAPAVGRSSSIRERNMTLLTLDFGRLRQRGEHYSALRTISR